MAARRDLSESGMDYSDLMTANAQRQAAFLQQVEDVTAPDDGLATLLSSVTDQTTALAGIARGLQTAAAAPANAKSAAARSAAGSGHASGSARSNQPKPQPKH
jgi:hypothetical protein